MSEARGNFRRGVGDSSTIYNLLNPSRGIRDDLQRKGIQPKDHMAENRKKIEEIKQKRIEESEEKERKSNQKLYKMKEFENVESKVNQVTQSIIDNNDNRHDFLKKKETVLPEPTRDYKREEKNRKPPIPKPIVGDIVPNEKKNYLLENKQRAITMKPKEHHVKPLVPPVDESHKFGKIPDYILRMKQEKMFEERYIREHLPDPDCPPGMVLLSEDERITTLASLTITLENLQRDQSRLPLVIELPSQRRRSQEIENKIKETEDAIKIFSREKVYVMPD